MIPDFLLINRSGATGVSLGGCVLTAAVKHELLLLLQINLTTGALELFVEAGFGLELPTRNRKVKQRRAALALLLGALTNFPAGGKGQEFFDAGNVEAVLVNKLAQALEPLHVVVGKESFTAAARWLDQTLAFIDSQGTGVDVQ
jgi:hypothetical protein